MSDVGQSEDGIEASTSGMMEVTMMVGEGCYNMDVTGTWTQEMSDQLCRICAKPNEYLIPIFEREGIEHQLETKIRKHLPIEVSETDDLPLQVCYQCASTLIAWNDLVITCIVADNKLHQMHVGLQKEEVVDDKGAQFFDQRSHVGNKEGEPVQHTTSSATITSDVQNNATLPPKRSGKAKTKLKTRQVGKSSMAGPSRQESRKTTTTKTKDGVSQEKPGNTITNGMIEQQHEHQLCNKEDGQDDKVELEDINGYLCSSCGKHFTTRSKLRYHENWMHSKKPKTHVCKLCGRGFFHIGKFRLHMLKHSGTKNVDCEVCGKKFYEKTELRQHMTCHSQERPFACKLCDGTFKRRTNLMTHEATMHGVVPEGHKSHQCLVCGKMFLIAKLLADHMKSHSQDFRCSRCGQSFVKKSSLSYHLKFIDCDSFGIIAEDCQCQLCGKIFKAKPNLRQHIRKVHEKGKNKFCCPKCGQECVGKRSYTYHLKHDCKPWPWKPRTMEVPEKLSHQCKVCGKVFKASSNLSQHVRKVHEKDKQDKFCCSVCGKLFQWKICLDEHVRIHLNLKPCICKICNKAFRTWSCLARHKKAHEDRRAYQCQMCGKAFKHNGTLQAHLRIHSGIKPHHCELCERSFIYYNEKIRHQHKVHYIHTEVKEEEPQSLDIRVTSMAIS